MDNIWSILVSVVASGLITFGALAFVVNQFKKLLNEYGMKVDAFLEKWIGDENSNAVYSKLQEMLTDLQIKLEEMKAVDSFQESEQSDSKEL